MIPVLPLRSGRSSPGNAGDTDAEVRLLSTGTSASTGPDGRKEKLLIVGNAVEGIQTIDAVFADGHSISAVQKDRWFVISGKAPEAVNDEDTDQIFDWDGAQIHWTDIDGQTETALINDLY